MDAEKQRTASEKEHLARSAAFSSAEAKVKALEKKLSRLVLRFSLNGTSNSCNLNSVHWPSFLALNFPVLYINKKIYESLDQAKAKGYRINLV